MKNKENNKKIQYGFLLALGCFLIQAIPFGVASNIHSQFLGYIVDEHNFSLGSISLMFTVGTIISAICSPTIGKLFNKISAKLIFTIGAILSAGGIFILSIAGNVLPLFYIGYGISQVGTAAISSIGIPVLLSSWFDDTTRGQVSGIVFAGSGLGNMFLQKLSAKWLVDIGYAQAYKNFSFLSLVVGVTISLLLVRMPKNDSEIIRTKSKKEENKEVKSTEKWGYNLKEVIKIKAYWIFAIGFIFIGIYVSALTTQDLAYLKSIGFDGNTLGTIGSIFAACSLLGNLIGGTLYDKLGAFKTTLLGFILATTSCTLLILAPNTHELAYIHGVSKGLSVFAYILGPSMLTGILFGNKELGSVLAITQVFFALGFAFGSAIFGAIVDIAGYNIAWITILISIVIAYTLILSAIKSMSKINKEKFER